MENLSLSPRAADCVRLSVQNLSKLADTLPAPEVSEAVSLILNFVKDSYPVSSALLLEFENGEGYPLLLKVLLRYDGLTQGEVEPELEELLELVMWLTTCGRSELKVFDSVTYPQLEGFKFHQEASGVTVKNLQAFQVLQNVFHRASDSVLCTKVLWAIKTMWAWNPRNFFLLEWTLQPISQFVEIMPLKSTSVQEHFFQLLETLVFKLLYVPHEILAKVQRLIKESPELSCTLVALRSILRITASDRLFTDIFRDSGLLGLLLAQLRKQAKIMRKSGNKEPSPGVQDPERELTSVMLNTVVTLLQGSVRNAVVLKDHGMVPFIKIFLDDECYRAASLSILEQLSVINAEEYMSIIVGALCSSTQGELQLKLDLLKSLLRILETPKGHAAFRVSSGFNGLLSLLSDLEGSLQVPVVPTWGAVSPRQTLELVLHTLCVVSAALHLDPVNGHFFRSNGLFEKLAEDLCLLGCFGAAEEEGAQRLSSSDMKARPFVDLLNCAFSSSCPFPPRNFTNEETKPENEEQPKAMMDEGDIVIMHPGIICIMVRLLPRLYLEDHPQLSEEIQCSLASHLLSLVKSEKNRQVMCEAGMLRTLMTFCHRTLSTGSCEATADKPTDASPYPGGSQDLRSSWTSQDSATALQTTLSLISMTSPRNLQPQRAALTPSFVEFDMSMEGYGCLFTPTLSTVMGTSTELSISGGTGSGTPRPFPPPGGLTFSCWFLISRQPTVMEGHPLRFLTLVRHLARTEQPFVCFSVSLCTDDLSLVVSTEEKEFQPLDVMEPEEEAEPSAGRQLQVRCSQLLTCGQWYHLAVVVSKEMKRNCTVTTYLDGEAIGSAKMLYVQALPGPFLSMDPSSFVDVYGYIGTPRVWKQKSSLIWRLGPAYLFEEDISADTLALLIKLGPRYCGNFQAVHLQGEDPDGEATPLIAEERVSFGLHVSSSSITSIMNIRNTYNEVDSRLIAKEMNISSRDNATPVFLLRNCAGHLSGSLRTLGAVAVGQLGVRVFHSSPAASSLDYIGGPAILLGLISLATDDHTMYAAMKVLHSVLTSNAMCDHLMQHICGYQNDTGRGCSLKQGCVIWLWTMMQMTAHDDGCADPVGDEEKHGEIRAENEGEILAFLLRKKTAFLNHRIFQLILSVAGTAELGFRPSAVTNTFVFQHVLCNFENAGPSPSPVEQWGSSSSSDRHGRQETREGPRNAEVAHQAQLVPKLIFLFNEPSLALSKVSTIIAILGYQLKGHFNIQDLLRSKEQVFLNLGPDWFLLLLQGHLHPSTTTLALKLLLYFLSNPSLRGRFRDGLSAGCWVECSMEGMDIVMGSGDSAWEQTLPSSILQFLRLVHRSYPQDPAWRTPDFLQTLAIITFPPEAQK
ncbi:hypothetical protein A6R68_18967, partial [Neotoma lepida]